MISLSHSFQSPGLQIASLCHGNPMVETAEQREGLQLETEADLRVNPHPPITVTLGESRHLSEP